MVIRESLTSRPLLLCWTGPLVTYLALTDKGQFWNDPVKWRKNMPSSYYLISPIFFAVADPTFFAALAVFEPASLNTDFVAAAPVLSLL